LPHRKNHVFFSHSGRRWKIVKRSMRLFIFFFLIALAVIIIALIRGSDTQLPKLVDKNEVYKKIVLTPELKKTTSEQPLNIPANFSRNKPKLNTPLPLAKQVRAGFYVNWDLQSYNSLKTNIDNMNMVLPEWLYIGDNVDTVITDIDKKALDVMAGKDVKIVPMISNYFNEKWNSDNAERIISSPEKRKKFIASVINVLNEYNFSGVNVDLENLKDNSTKKLMTFQKELYDELKKNNFIVSQDINALNDNYDIANLQRYNDYIFVMAYDQHEEGSAPGPIAAEDWFEKVLETVTAKVPSEKLVIGIACYGYDWPKGYHGADITYLEALRTAKESEGNVEFDSSSYNLTFNYYDENDYEHEVWFTDAATNYNQMREASDYDVAGFALWRLGGEDTRVWKFYRTMLDDKSIDGIKMDPEGFSTSVMNSDIDYIGEGEILDVVATPQEGKINVNFDRHSYISNESYEQLPLSYIVRKFGKGNKQIMLTFDDGPDEKWTPQILDILKQENIPAVFFVVGVNAENNIPLLKRIFDEGHEIGNHTFTHPNLAKVSSQRANLELNSTRRLIECVTGHSTILFRPPFNADSEPQTLEEILPVDIGKQNNFYTVGESIDPRDWQEGIQADSIYETIVREQGNGSIILLHDSGGDRTETIKALPRIIKHFRDKGYSFITVHDLIGTDKEKVMPKIYTEMDNYFSYANYTTATIVYWSTHVLYTLFVLAIAMSIIRLIFIGATAGLQKFRSKKKVYYLPDELPKVSVIIPAHNEEINSVKTITNLLKSDYPSFNVIFTDDGSTDNTYKAVSEKFGSNPDVIILSKPNGGKASALNYGISASESEFIICIDADTQLRKNAITEMIKCFYDGTEDIAAVAGNVKVGNEVNILSKWQSVEYITSQNFDRRAFDLLNCITVVPGAIGAFRRSAVEEAGGFSHDTLAEDCDLTISLLKCGFKVSYCEKAIAMTEAPESFRMFFRQRFRWSYGITQSLWKHRDAIFRSEHGALGWAALPNILIYQIIMPVISPAADVIMALSILSGHFAETMGYYFLFLLSDLISAAIAFSFERENVKNLWLLIPQRFIYRQVMYLVLFKSLYTAIRGSLTSWGVIKRTGNVDVVHS
jgi:cellulose synthase/poly-beta-1,6-N-acetylglucosamine synthase-like glycosyltransferase/spore germination protein YaaH/peptidoglycan/xylan/chitin deacetylase (PgdA/CDA1 family)